MRRFKIGFLAILAIAAMSFTVAENKGMFKDLKLHPTATCVQNLDATSVTYFDSGCSGSTSTITNNGTDACPSPITSLDNKVVSSSTLASSNITCSGSSKFCCAVLGTATCQGVTKTIISSVYCKP